MLLRSFSNWSHTLNLLMRFYVDLDYLQDSLFQIAAFLDVKFGPSIFVDDDEREQVRLKVLTAMTQLAPQVASAAASSSTTTTTTAKLSTTSTTSTSIDPEFSSYATTLLRAERPPTVPPSVRTPAQELAELVDKLWQQCPDADAVAVDHDPIAWYLTGPGAAFPTARAVALAVLTVPAGEASSERVFSAAGWFDSARRKFAPRTLSAMTFLKINQKPN